MFFYNVMLYTTMNILRLQNFRQLVSSVRGRNKSPFLLNFTISLIFDFAAVFSFLY